MEADAPHLNELRVVTFHSNTITYHNQLGFFSNNAGYHSNNAKSCELLHALFENEAGSLSQSEHKITVQNQPCKSWSGRMKIISLI